jgi:hypothetical protein
MAFAHKYEPVLKGFLTYTAGSSFGTSDIGKLITFGTSDALNLEKAALPVGTTCDLTIGGIFYGFLPGTATAATNLSTSVQVLVQPILPGEVIRANYSTSVVRVAAANVIATTSIGKFFGIGATTTAQVGLYIDPSVASSVPGTTNGLFFKLMGFDTNADVCWGIINTSHIVY